MGREDRTGAVALEANGPGASHADADGARPRPSAASRIRAMTTEHHDFLLVLLLFLALRFMALALVDQDGSLGGGSAHDYWFYRSFAELSLRGQYPFIDYWLEYPPVFAWLVVGIYKLSLFIPPLRIHIFSFYILLGSVLMLADAGTLTLIYLIARRTHGPAVGLRAAVIYALLFLPLYVALGWYDSIPAFFLLASLYLLITGHPRLSAVVSGVGFMTKMVPALAVPIALRALWRWRDRLVYLLVWAVAVALLAVPFLIANPAMLEASFRSALARSSWETIWALLDDFYDVGLVVGLEGRFTPETAAWQGHPSTLPWLWITLAFGVVSGLVYLRRLDWQQPRKTVALAAFTVSLFFIYSKGYSPQFAVFIVPFIVLLLPNLWGVALLLFYSVANFVEYPIYPMILSEHPRTLWLAVSARTLILVLIALESASLLCAPVRLYLQAAKARLAWPALIGAVLAAALGGALLYGDYANQGDYYVLKRYVEPLSTPRQLIVVSSTEAFASIHAQLPGYDYYVMTEDWGGRVEQVVDELTRLVQDRPQIWLVLDGVRGDDGRFALLQKQIEGFGVPAANSWFETFRLVNMVGPRGATETVPRRTEINARFGDQLVLENVGLSADATPPGSPVRIAARWRVAAPIERDWSLFVHMLLPGERAWSQIDTPLMHNGAPTSAWRVGDVIETAANLAIPAGTPPVEYRLILGLYDPRTGQRLPLTGGHGGPNWLELGSLRVTNGPFLFTKKFGVQPLARFPEGLRIKGIESSSEVRAGGSLGVNVFWQSPAGQARDVVAFYKLVDRQGHVVATDGGVPGDASYPPSVWPAGEIVRDQRRLAVSPNAPPGVYELVVHVEPAGASSGERTTPTLQTLSKIRVQAPAP